MIVALSAWKGNECVRLMQVLAEAQQQLRTVVQAQVEEAVGKQEHDTVVRFVRLYAPLRMKVPRAVDLMLLSCSLIH